MGIKNLESANAAAYLSEKPTFLSDLAANDEELTVAAIQGFVNEVNKSQVSEAEKEEAAKAVVAALGNNIELRDALAAFDKVNNAWIEDVTVGTTPVDGYATVFTTSGGPNELPTDGTVTAAQVQAGIDAVNEAIISANITELSVGTIDDGTGTASSVDKAKLTALKTMIETYAPVDADGEYVNPANQTALDNVEAQIAVADVLAATTASTFKARVTTLAGIVNIASTKTVDLDKYVDANGKDYIDKIKAVNATGSTVTVTGVNGAVNTAAEIQTVIEAVNDELKEDATVGLFKDLETAISNLGATPTATQKANFVAALNALEIEQVSSNKANVDEYIKTATTTAIDTASKTVTAPSTDPTTPDTSKATVDAAIAAIQAEIDKANLAVVQNATTEAGIIAALNVMEIENVVEANAAAYLADTTGVMDKTNTTDATKLQTAVDAVNTAEAIQAAVDAINDAETATEVKAALDTLANEGEVAGYLNVTSADRIFIAEQVLDARADETDEEYASKTEVGNAVTAAVTARTNALKYVNALVITDDLTDIADGLLLVGHDSLTGTAGTTADGVTITGSTPTANDTAIADAFITSLEFDETTGAITPQFRSIAQIRAAIDAAIK
jgi:hypothetical protein